METSYDLCRVKYTIKLQDVYYIAHRTAVHSLQLPFFTSFSELLIYSLQSSQLAVSRELRSGEASWRKSPGGERDSSRFHTSMREGGGFLQTTIQISIRRGTCTATILATHSTLQFISRITIIFALFTLPHTFFKSVDVKYVTVLSSCLVS